MRVCLVDDESTQLDYLKLVIENWSSKQNTQVLISIYQSAEEMLFECGNTFPFDLIILDIQMQKINGIELAKKIRKYDPNVMIVFLSGISDYVYEGYEVMALRYLLKPLKEEQLFEILDLVSEKKIEKPNYMIITSAGETKKIAFDDIFYIESLGHYVVINTKKSEIEIKKNLNDMILELESNQFIKTHRSYIVNLKYIEQIKKDRCVLTNKKTVPISRSLYKLVNSEFIKYYRGKEL